MMLLLLLTGRIRVLVLLLCKARLMHLRALLAAGRQAIGHPAAVSHLRAQTGLLFRGKWKVRLLMCPSTRARNLKI